MMALDGLRFRVYPPGDASSQDELLAAIERGEVDFCNTLARDAIQQLSGVRKFFMPGISTAILFINTESPRLKNRHLRRAVARSIDRMEVARSMYSNPLAFAAGGLLPRVLADMDDDLRFDRRAARAELEENGLEFPAQLSLLEIWAPRPYLPHPKKVTAALVEQFAAFGVHLETHATTSSADYFDRVMRGDHDLSLGGWIADTLDPADFLESTLASDRIPTPEQEHLAISSNDSRLSSVDMDRALGAYRRERSPELLAEIFALFARYAPLVPLCYGPTTAVWSFRCENFLKSPLSIFPFTHIKLQSDRPLNL